MNPRERYLVSLRDALPLDRDQQQSILAEVTDHLSVAADWWQQEGLSEAEAWEQAIREFGPPGEVAAAFAETHRGWGTNEAIAAAALPVFLTIALKWLIAPLLDLPRSWEVLTRPELLSTAVLLLLIPLAWKTTRWRYGLGIWIVFWFFTIIGAGA